jgi:hypothetical protein
MPHCGTMPARFARSIFRANSRRSIFRANSRRSIFRANSRRSIFRAKSRRSIFRANSRRSIFRANSRRSIFRAKSILFVFGFFILFFSYSMPSGAESRGSPLARPRVNSNRDLLSSSSERPRVNSAICDPRSRAESRQRCSNKESLRGLLARPRVNSVPIPVGMSLSLLYRTLPHLVYEIAQSLMPGSLGADCPCFSNAQPLAEDVSRVRVAGEAASVGGLGGHCGAPLVVAGTLAWHV